MLCKTFRNSSRHILVIMAVVLLITLAAAAPSGAQGTAAVKPPTSGPYAYGVFGPNETTFPKLGSIYVKGTQTDAGDPRFGGRVRRITSEFPNPSKSDIYSKNGFWSADGKLMYHLTTSETKTLIDTATGASVPVPGGYQGFDGSFAPNDLPGGPYSWYFFSGQYLMKYSISISAGGTSLVAAGPDVVHDFGTGVVLGGLGGSVDWIDNSGQYMVLNINGTLKVWDGRTLYTNTENVNAANVVLNGGWMGISPDGNYVVVSTEGTTGQQQISYAIDHTMDTLMAGKLFWTLCGGHGDLVSAGGRTYLVTFDCYGSAFPGFENMPPAIYAVDVNPLQPVRATNDPSNSDDEAGRNAQRTSTLNKKLFEVAWGDDGHFSGVSRGALREWAFISIESGEDTFGRTLDATKRSPEWWTRPYMQEIVMVNVVTGQVERVAHHRSRSVNDSYYYQPRVSVSWGDCGGASAAWLSNFGQLKLNKKGQPTRQPNADYADIYAVDVTAADVLSATPNDFNP